MKKVSTKNPRKSSRVCKDNLTRSDIRSTVKMICVKQRSDGKQYEIDSNVTSFNYLQYYFMLRIFYFFLGEGELCYSPWCYSASRLVIKCSGV